MLKFLRLTAFVLLPVLMALPASAQTYPNRTVKLIVPFGAGGPADVYARVLAHAGALCPKIPAAGTMETAAPLSSCMA